MKTFNNPCKVFLKGALKMLTLSSTLLVASCTTDEVITENLSGDNSNDLSSKSVLLSDYEISTDTQQAENPIENVYDNDLSTRWSGFGTSANIFYDFGEVIIVDYAEISFHNGDERVYNITYWISEDGVSWRWINGTSSSGETEDYEIFDFTNTSTRYFRIKFEGNSENEWNSVNEVKMYGTTGVSNGSGEVQVIVNESDDYTPIPGVIQAEHYSTQYGTLPEPTIDAGGGENIGYLSTNDYLTYNINVPETGLYKVDFRVASYEFPASFDIYEGDTRLNGVSKEASGGWQVWKTTSKTVKLTEGNQILKLISTGNGWNINWIEFTKAEDDGTIDEDNEQEEENMEEGATGGTPYDILGDVIKDWKITYPVDEDGSDSANADECDDRNNNAYEMRDLTGTIPGEYAKYFFVSGDEVVFKAHVGGATTSGSSYPRSEFRQLVGGDDNYWSMDEYQYLETRVRATHLPKVKPEVSMVQIHGPDDEPLRVEYREGSQGLHVVQNEDDTVNYVMDYELGQQLFVTVTVDEGDITLYMKNEDTGETYTDTWEAEDSTGYFKVGCYTQSNNNLPTCKPGEGYNSQDADEYGEVRVKDLKLIETY